EDAQHHRLRRRRLGPEAEPRRQQTEELGPVHHRVVEHHRPHLPALLRLQRRAQQRRLAETGLANHHRDRLRQREPVFQVRERLAVLRREEQVLRIRRELEGTLAQAKETLVHVVLSPHLTSTTTSFSYATGVVSFSAGRYFHCTAAWV